MSEYAILATVPGGDEFEEYPLAPTTRGTVKAFRELQVKSAYYDGEQRRQIAKEEGHFDQIMYEEENEEDDTLSFRMVEAELTTDDFITESAKVLFPAAPIEGNEDYIDQRVWEEAKSDFLSLIGKRDPSFSLSSEDLMALLNGVTSANGSPPVNSPTANNTSKQ